MTNDTIEERIKILEKIIDRQNEISENSSFTLFTPVIEVAGDEKTAKGVWISPGAACLLCPIINLNLLLDDCPFGQ